jgi:acyl carrier protein
MGHRHEYENGARGNLSELAVSAARYTNEESYWLNKLGGELGRARFPVDRTGMPAGADQRPMAKWPFRLDGQLFERIMKISRGSEPRVFMVLAAGLAALLHKYAVDRTNDDVILGTTIYKQEVEGEFINTVLALRNSVSDDMTFRELLGQVRQTVSEANENANYPIETLLYQLNMTASPRDFPLFDAAVLLENIHDKGYFRDIRPNMMFVFTKTDRYIDGAVEYHSLRYQKTTVEMIAARLVRLLEKLLGAVDARLGDIELLDGDEQRRIIEEFNGTACQVPYPLDRAVHQVFERQVETAPDAAAAVDGQRLLTYRELNARANQVGHLLRKKGVKPDHIVGIMVERSLELLVGILAILKAGGAYLAVDAAYPGERKAYMLKNCNVNVLLTVNSLLEPEAEVLENIPGRGLVLLDDESVYGGDAADPVPVNRPGDLVYVIYTSGSTGRPKGVLVRHRGLVNMAGVHRDLFGEDRGSRMSQVAAQGFDAMAFEIWPCLLSGACLHIAGDDTRIDPAKMKQWLIANGITISFQPTMMAERLLREQWPARGAALETLRTAGEALILGGNYQTSFPFRFYNLYGPTEDTIWTTWTEITWNDGAQQDKTPPIGKPVGNHRVFIMDRSLKLQPIGIPGEITITGEGLARGYLNNPELTSEKFNKKFFRGSRGAIFQKSPPGRRRQLYKTGDLGRWLPDGSIEFLGRLDHQVKIRGYRIELGEIENRLLKIPAVAEAAVVDRSDENNEKYLVAYVAAQEAPLDVSQVREELSRSLPDYMIPAFFVSLDAIPLNDSGKVDRGALPEPDLSAGVEYIAPRSEVERKMAAIWSEVLGVDKDVIGIDANFFALGGHSLKAIKLVARIHEVFDIKIPVGEVFDLQTIRGLAQYVETSGGERFSRIEPAPVQEYYPLSPAQERIYVVQQMNLQSASYNAPQFIPLPGAVDAAKLEDTFKKLIQRHESLRTSFETRDQEPVQIIHAHVPFKIEVFDVPAGDAGSGQRVRQLAAGFRRPFDLSRAPLLRVSLVRVGEEQALLMIDTHLIVCDGESNDILKRDFMALYTGEELPPLRLQYKDYAVWQAGDGQRRVIEEQEAYWLDRFKDGAPVLELPIDFERPEIQDFAGDLVRSRLSGDLKGALDASMQETGTTMFMTALAVLSILLSKYSGQEDIVVGTPISGRPHADLENILGMFVNMLPLRNFPRSDKTFAQFLEEVKHHSLRAYENQDYPFDRLVDKLGLWKVVDRSPLFNVVLSTFKVDIDVGDADGGDQQAYDLSRSDSKFDLRLNIMEARDAAGMSLQYKTSLFKRRTIEKMNEHLLEIFQQVLENRDIRLGDIEISHDILAADTQNEGDQVGFNF